MRKISTSRRQFIQGAAAAGAGFWVSTRGLAQSNSPNEKLNVGFVGVANQGRYDLDNVIANASVNAVALCDVEENNLNAAAMIERCAKAQKYRDFRKMLDQKDIDAVVVATPDHLHFHASMMALQSGRHVYCEKPLTHQVWEARALNEMAMSKKLVTQMGTQIHASPNYRRVVELIQSGAIGNVKEVHVLMGGRWAAGDRPQGTPPVPPTLDYDLWLGPAEPWPYHPTYLPANWRSWWNFGNGTLGDMACHHVDLPFWALGLKHPTKITPVAGPPPHPDGAPEWLTVKWDFAAEGDRPAVSITWWGGDQNRPEQMAEWGIPEGFGAGNIFVGEKGVLFADYGQHGLRPEADFANFQRPPETIPPSIGHHNEWVEAAKAGDHLAPLCNFSYSGPLTETVLLGCVAYRAQTPLEWDAANLKITNTTEADKYFRRAYRQGWELEV